MSTTQELTVPVSGKRLMQSNSQLKMIIGGVGSGKSTSCLLAIVYHAMRQPIFNNKRTSCFCVVRSTVPELISTTIKTCTTLFPTLQMSFSYPITGLLEFLGKDGVLVRIEFVFLAVRSTADIRKLLSIEFTGLYLNEVTQLPFEILAAGQKRNGRYPPKRRGGVNWFGTICDSNAPPSNHWLKSNFYAQFPVETPPNGDWIDVNNTFLSRQKPSVFKFPNDAKALKFSEYIKQHYKSAHSLDVTHSLNGDAFVLNPEADNLNNLPKSYYTNNIPNTTTPDIEVNFMGYFKNSYFRDSVCYPMFDPVKHVTSNAVNPELAKYIVLGWDFGLNPACVILAVIATPTNYDVHVLGEVVGKGIGLSQFIPNVWHRLDELRIQRSSCVSYIDMSGGSRAQANEITCTSVLHDHGFQTGVTVTQNILARLEGVRNLLYRSEGFSIHSSCEMLIEGFESEYKYSEAATIKGDLKPDKNFHSNIQDALQYAVAGISILMQQHDLAALNYL